MAAPTRQRSVWEIAAAQHGVVTRRQLEELGFSVAAIRHRRRTGRLHLVHRGVYAVGRPELTQEGRWMAAVLACGNPAALSHGSAAALWQIDSKPPHRIHVSTLSASRSREAFVVHRRTELSTTTHEGIPTTTPIQTLIDLSAAWPTKRLEAAINEADKRDLVHPESLHAAARTAGREASKLTRLLTRQIFLLTDSELERYFLPIARKAGLPAPLTQQWIGNHRVDFFWPQLLLAVETDGGRYHRTAAQQTQDRINEHALMTRGITVVRFTHAQVVYDAAHVTRTLRAVANRRP